ncbi:galactoside 2-alpha-L-fucosyltransferase-like [Silene latifolia]|uniref:galactoside 2-alpha-L-fucosyltransferase-like n=1 Tax=Silene latifolia TaxID=37657 RepID=UPI003D76BAD5
MRNLQFFRDLQLTELFSKRISEVRKHSRVTTILFICFTALVIFKVKNSKQILFQPSSNTKCSDKFDQNITASVIVGYDTLTVIYITGERNNTSKGGVNNTSNIPVKHEQGLFKELAPLFNKNSCLSRFQHSSYRKNKPYNPSPYLISKLRAYQDLHSRCGPLTLSYKRAIRKLSSPSSSTSTTTTDPTQCKYLVWTPANGLGNRIVSITSAFLYALLQSRVLLVEFRPEMDDLFCEPFPNSTWLFPNSFPLTHNWTNITSLKDQVNSRPLYFLNLQHGNGDFTIRHFHCNDTQSLLQTFPVLILKTDQYFAPSLFLMPSFKQELNRMFPLKGSVFHLLGRYLFNPSNNAWGLITRFYQAYLAHSDMKIGLQVRVFAVNKVPYEQIMKQILSCILPNHILPSFGTNVSLSQNSTPTPISKSVLVSSLYPQFSEQLRNMYWVRPTLTGDVIGVYQPSHEEYQKFGDNMHNMKAWAEMYLLSLCDVLVTSGQSTFGYVAQGLGGLKPWILDKLDGRNARNSSCKRGISSEPCFHIAPTNDCSGDKIGNITAVNSHLRQCEDMWWGMKLVND